MNLLKDSPNVWATAAPEVEPRYTPVKWEAANFKPKGGGGGGGMRMAPQQMLDMSRSDYGLQTIWGPDLTIGEALDWANEQAFNEDLTQFDRNTYTDPMAKRKGEGRYYMNTGETYAPSAGHRQTGPRAPISSPTRDYSTHIGSAYGL